MKKLKLGDEIHGGIVFFIDETNVHGLIVSKYDLSATADWNEAIKFCIDYREGEFDDWRLPTIDELNILYINKDRIGSFVRFSYWSSSEYADHFAWFQHFHNGVQDNDFKDNTCYVRAIRSF